jgi:hypothetical protein
MKSIYLSLSNRLAAEIPLLKTIDFDTNQLENYDPSTGDRPNVAFPCALFSINYPNSENIGGGSQQHYADITIRVAFQQLTRRTGVNVPDDLRLKALDILDTIDNCRNALHNYSDYTPDSGETYTPLAHPSTIREPRPDEYTIYRPSSPVVRLGLHRERLQL